MRLFSQTGMRVCLVLFLFVAVFCGGVFAASADAVMPLYRDGKKLDRRRIATYLVSPEQERVLVTAGHGIADAPLEELTVRTKAGLFGFDYGDSMKNRRYLEEKYDLARVDGFIQLAKAPEPYKNGVDCFVLTPLYELPGIEPLHCSDASPRVGDKMTAATFNGLAPCKVSNPMFNGQYLELCADSRIFQTGFSGASIIMDESGTGAMAMLVMIGDYGDRPRKDSEGFEYVTSDFALCVYLSDIFGPASPRDAESVPRVASETTESSVRR